MAQAYAKWFDHVEYEPLTAKDRLDFEIHFSGPDVPGGYLIAVAQIELNPGDPTSQIRPKMTAAIQFEASARGLVVAKQDMAIPVPQQGV